MDGYRRLAVSLTGATHEVSCQVRRALGVLFGAWAALVLLAGATAARAADAVEAVDPHAHHHHMMAETVRTTASYTVPQVALVRDDGKSVVLSNELDDGRPVVLDFIYTTCTTICPVTSLMLSELQRRLGASRDQVHIVSISIDPEQDTPARLREYATRFSAGPEWQHYTGTVAASVTSQRAFDVYRGDKMDHSPVTLLRTKPGAPWVRIEGFASVDQILTELRPVISASR